MSRARDGWTRRPGPTGSTCGASWIHTSGWAVQHCGHPTALWPYYGVPAEGVDDETAAALISKSTRGQLRWMGCPILIAPNGYAFRHLLDAQLAVEEIASFPLFGVLTPPNRSGSIKHVEGSTNRPERPESEIGTMASKKTSTRKSAAAAAKKTAPARRTVADDILEGTGAGAARVSRARARRGAQPAEPVAPAPAAAEDGQATSAPESAELTPVQKDAVAHAVEAGTVTVSAPAKKSPPAPEGTIKTLLRGSSAKALGFDQQRPEWLPEPAISRQGTAQESWRFNLEPAVLLQLVQYLEASGQNGPVTKDAKYLRTLVPAELLPPSAPAAEPAAAAV